MRYFSSRCKLFLWVDGQSYRLTKLTDIFNAPNLVPELQISLFYYKSKKYFPWKSKSWFTYKNLQLNDKDGNNMFNQTFFFFLPCTINVIVNLLAIMLIYHICKYVLKHHVSYMLSAYTFFLWTYLQVLANNVSMY